MAHGELSKVQKQQVADAAIRKALELRDFRWEVVKVYMGTESRLVHKPTKSWFIFGGFGDNASQWWPEHEFNSAGASAYAWDAQLSHAVRWLGMVKREHDTPDVFAAASAEPAL